VHETATNDFGIPPRKRNSKVLRGTDRDGNINARNVRACNRIKERRESCGCGGPWGKWEPPSDPVEKRRGRAITKRAIEYAA